jgi:hypothetical protein
MSHTANHGTYAASPWDPGAHWGGIPPWVRQLDIRPVWIALTILGFIAWWPIGLALLVFLLGSGRMGCGFGRRHGGRGHRWARACQGDVTGAAEPTSGNRAFDAYRAETLQRLEQEQRDFAAFLDRLRFAKDKVEFDAFMADRPHTPEQPEQPTPGT